MSTGLLDEDRISTRLRERGQRVTPQRLILLRVLNELGHHVTAEELLAAASERLPNVSAPTVYATLVLFEKLGLVRRLRVGGVPVLYDPRVEEHHHAVCHRCGAVADVEAPVDASRALRKARSRGFRPDHAEVLLVGLCEDCASR